MDAGAGFKLELSRSASMLPMTFVRYLRALLVPAALSIGAPAAAQQAPDEAAIRSVRARNNAAIAAHDVKAMAEAWLPDYVGVTSRNARDVGRDAARDSYAELIRTRPEVVFVRTPTAVTVNTQWLQAAENGRWTGTWKAADGPVRVGGIYFAKWLKTNGEWKILTETFVQTTCTGGSYCATPPAP
jgi:ketosteroid isomerase-like protein